MIEFRNPRVKMGKCVLTGTSMMLPTQKLTKGVSGLNVRTCSVCVWDVTPIWKHVTNRNYTHKQGQKYGQFDWVTAMQLLPEAGEREREREVCCIKSHSALTVELD